LGSVGAPSPWDGGMPDPLKTCPSPNVYYHTDIGRSMSKRVGISRGLLRKFGERWSHSHWDGGSQTVRP